MISSEEFYLYAGFVLEGFDISYDEDKLRTILHSGTQPLAVSKPRFIHGLHAPGQLTCTLFCVHCFIIRASKGSVFR